MSCATFLAALGGAGHTVHIGPGAAIRVYPGEDGELYGALDAIAGSHGYERHRGPSDDYYSPSDLERQETDRDLERDMDRARGDE